MSKVNTIKLDVEVTMTGDPVTLDPTDEFEAVLIEMVAMHRRKRAIYGSETDALQNFYNIAATTGVSPMMAAEVLGGKHASVIKMLLAGHKLGKTTATDDAVTDRAVYAVLAKVLYSRDAIYPV